MNHRTYHDSHKAMLYTKICFSANCFNIKYSVVINSWSFIVKLFALYCNACLLLLLELCWIIKYVICASSRWGKKDETMRKWAAKGFLVMGSFSCRFSDLSVSWYNNPLIKYKVTLEMLTLKAKANTEIYTIASEWVRMMSMMQHHKMKGQHFILNSKYNSSCLWYIK